MFPENHRLASLGNPMRDFSMRHFNWLMFGGLGIVITVLYSPILNAYFISDDFAFLAYLHFFAQDVLNGQRWGEWFLGGIQGYVFFRPVANVFWVLNYVAFKIDPLGYHLVSVLFHWLASYLVFLLSYLLTRDRIAAGIGAVLFAAMSVHAEAVSWVAAVYDPICGVFFFASVLFFGLYLQQLRRRWYVIAFVAFVAALSSKEIALTFPGVILLYDVMFYRLVPLRIGERVKRHAPFWVMVAIRILAFGHGNSGLRLNEVNWWGWLDGLLVRTGNPLVTESSAEIRIIALLSVAFVLWVYRSRPEVAFGTLWIPITFVPTVVGEVSDRSFYISSFGLAVALASILTQLVQHPRRLMSVLVSAILAALILIYSVALISTNQAIRRAGDTAETILKQIVTLHPTPSPDERLIFVGLPDQVPEGPLVFLTGFRAALQVSYQSKAPNPFKFAKFPIWLDDLDKTFFFEVNHRSVAERADLVQRLKERAQCQNYSAPFLKWNYSSSPLDWESWNQLSEWVIRDGALTMRAEGNDPIMASPPIDLPALAIGEIQIVMRVRASQPDLRGELYWLASGQPDFSPGLKASFPVLADDEWHTYRVDMAKGGMLLMGDHITQIRLDPTNVPADIAIQSISISTHCGFWQNERCICAPQ